MSLGPCLPGLEADGKITADQAAQARALYDERLAAHLREGSRESAEALASADVLDALEREVTRKAFLAGRTIKVRNRVLDDLDRYGTDTGDKRFRVLRQRGDPLDPKAASALLDDDPLAPYSSLEGRRKAVLGESQALMDDVLHRFSADIVGNVRNKATLRDMVDELFGGNSGNAAARELATAWRKSAELVRQRYNRAGGAIGFRADWGLPQLHDWKKVRAAGFDEWRAKILPRLDLGKMIDNRTGKPFTRESLEAVLPEIFDRVRSNGATDLSPGAPRGKALANRRADERFFVFRSADDWLAYAEEFGNGNAFDAMVGHLEGMARDTAALEVLGPNPDATLRFVKDTLEQRAKIDRDPGSAAIKRAQNAGKDIDALWDEYNGAHLNPRNETLALVFSNLRALQTATKLGSATLSATSDLAFTQTRAAMNGLNQVRMLERYAKLMVPGSLEDQRLAVRRGLIADDWTGRTGATGRFVLGELDGELSRRIAGGVIRASGLARHTQMLRWANGMEWLATFTEMAGRSFDTLEPPQRNALSRAGIGAGDWDRLRLAKMDSDRGVEWISPHNAGDPDLASRFMEMIHAETDLAVPVPDLKTRAKFNSIERGTVLGEIALSGLQFKSFGITVMLRQFQQIMAMNAGHAAGYAGGLVIGTTLMGALALQLKALAQGQDPRAMGTGEFWGAALLQGGGFGIFGDFLGSAQSRTGGGLQQALAGPLVADAQSIINVAKAKDPVAALAREAPGFIPGNNLWYARLAFDRLVADQIEQLVNPNFARGQRSMERFAAEQGTRFWWRPGADAPARAPDFANALEQGPDE